MKDDKRHSQGNSNAWPDTGNDQSTNEDKEKNQRACSAIPSGHNKKEKQLNPDFTHQ
jgi:hypothetical protein